jgi:DNA-binding NtrC family response regulator
VWAYLELLEPERTVRKTSHFDWRCSHHEAEGTRTRAAGVLSVSPVDADHARLDDIFQDPKWNVHRNGRWTLCRVASLASAADALEQEKVPIIISEGELLPGTWREMLEHISLLPDPPLLIVTSRLADERLWAEALNLGAYDVLAKPFDATEVIRIVSLAWQHWQDRHELHANRTKQRKAVAGT